MNIALWIVQILLAGLYAITGVLKVFQTARVGEMLPWVKRHPENFVHFVGASELLGAVGMILPWLTPLAAVGLALVQLLAIFTEHVPNKEYKALPMNVILLVLALFVAFGRF